MTSAPRSYLRRYGLALIITLAAISITVTTPLRAGAPFLLVMVAVLLSTWYGGLGPGLVASGLATVAALDFVDLPLGSFAVDDWNDVPRLGLFLLSSLIVCVITAERDRARKTAESHARQQAANAHLGERALAGADALASLTQAPVVLAQTLGLEYSYVLELLEDGDSLRLVDGYGWEEGTVGQTTLSRRTLSMAHYTLLSNAPVIATDLGAEKRFAPPRFLLDRGIVSGMTVMILGAGKPFGIVGAFSTHRRIFTQDDIHFLQSIANILASAIQHQEAEDSLRQREQAFRALADHSPDIIHRFDRELRTVYMNPAAERASGIPGNNSIGKTSQELGMREPALSNWIAAIREVFDSGTEKQTEFQSMTARGGGYFESRLVPEFDRAGQVESVLVVTRDITDRKRAEQALWESKELLETMFSSIDLMVAYMDKEFNFIRVNRAYAAADGREPEFYVGKNHFALFPHPENEAIFRRVVETGEPFSVYAKPFEYAEHPERGVSHWDWTLLPVKDKNGNVTGVVLSLVNVSERVQAQEALQAAAEQMRELARETILLQEEDRQRLSNTLYNDTTQIMAAILLNLLTVCADLPAGLEPMRDKLHDASEQLGKAINGARSLASDLHPPALETLGLDGALTGLCEDLSLRTGIKINYASTALDGLSDTHAIFLYRFVQEALSNATRHACAKRILVSLQKELSKVTATVQDDGVGFDAQTALPSLHGKRGSGLAAMGERLKLLGGHLEIDAQPGQGTRLTAEIPLS
jgi:PAS domain S-box-containing protein